MRSSSGNTKEERISNAAKREVPPVSVQALGISYTLFQLAALNEENHPQSTLHPLSDRYAQATLTDEGFQRGMGVLSVHFDYPDVPNAAMDRIAAFVRMLQEQASAPSPGWRDFCEHYDFFNPIIRGMAWCPLLRGEPFDAALFIHMAESALLGMEQEQQQSRIN